MSGGSLFVKTENPAKIMWSLKNTKIEKKHDLCLFSYFRSQYFDKDGDRAHEFYEERFMDNRKGCQFSCSSSECMLQKDIFRSQGAGVVTVG